MKKCSTTSHCLNVPRCYELTVAPAGDSKNGCPRAAQLAVGPASPPIILYTCPRDSRVIPPEHLKAGTRRFAFRRSGRIFGARRSAIVGPRRHNPTDNTADKQDAYPVRFQAHFASTTVPTKPPTTTPMSARNIPIPTNQLDRPAVLRFSTAVMIRFAFLTFDL